MSPRLALAPLFVSCVLILSGCYALRGSHGGGQTDFEPPRRVAAEDIAVPSGYRIEPVVTGLTFPSAVVTDDANRVYVVEAGYSYGEAFAVPRLLRLDAGGRLHEVARGRAGPWTGVGFHDRHFYVAESGTPGRVLRVAKDGTIAVLADNLPGRTDHFTDRPVVGPDGWLYFGQGTATNSGVVGEDNLKMGWLGRSPLLHDIPCRDVILAGRNFTTADVLGGSGKREVKTGDYVPFGTPTQPGQRVRGQLPCTGAIMRIPINGGAPELVAFGLRHPFGLAFTPDGRLFATDNGYDERGSRPVFGTADFLWEITPGGWYGWPDFAGGEPLTDPCFKPPGGPQPEFLLPKHPGIPPQPVAYFGVHSSSNGLDLPRSQAFGHVGEAFVAQFGDMAAQTGKVLSPIGFKVVRVNPVNGVIEDFAVNKGKHDGPASLLGTGGLERPVDVRFDNTGNVLYVLDFGVMTVGKKPEPRRAMGVLWRVVRDEARTGAAT